GVYTLPVISALQGPDGAELRQALAEADSPAAVDRAIDLVRRSGAIAEALATADRYADTARRAVAHLDQCTAGEGLARFPHTYATWALQTLIDPRHLDRPVAARDCSAHGTERAPRPPQRRDDPGPDRRGGA